MNRVYGECVPSRVSARKQAPRVWKVRVSARKRRLRRFAREADRELGAPGDGQLVEPHADQAVVHLTGGELRQLHQGRGRVLLELAGDPAPRLPVVDLDGRV